MPGKQLQQGLVAAVGAVSAAAAEAWDVGPANEQRPVTQGTPSVAEPRSGVVRSARREGVPAPAILGRGGEALVGRTEQGLHIERLIAEGGMGAVYAARRIETGEQVALKVLRWEHVADPGITSRFVREVRFARRIDHPNVCPVLADGRLSDGRPFFVMPLYAGTTLGEEVRQRGPLSVDRALAIMDQVLAGLAAMHAARVVHRDLQPNNVLLLAGTAGAVEGAAPPTRPSGGATPERDHGVSSLAPMVPVRLIDLGFAQEPGVDAGDGLTPDSPGALVGTLRFMSPEQAMRSRAITERSDIFGAALLLYYMLTGELPFRGRTDVEVLVNIVRAAPVPLRRLRRDAPRALEQVLARAFSKHPDARFGSAAEMRSALAAIAQTERAASAHPRRARSLH